jgi:hypothetical protein
MAVIALKKKPELFPATRHLRCVECCSVPSLSTSGYEGRGEGGREEWAAICLTFEACPSCSPGYRALERPRYAYFSIVMLHKARESEIPRQSPRS